MRITRNDVVRRFGHTYNAIIRSDSRFNAAERAIRLIAKTYRIDAELVIRHLEENRREKGDAFNVADAFCHVANS